MTCARPDEYLRRQHTKKMQLVRLGHARENFARVMRARWCVLFTVIVDTQHSLYSDTRVRWRMLSYTLGWTWRDAPIEKCTLCFGLKNVAPFRKIDLDVVGSISWKYANLIASNSSIREENLYHQFSSASC